MRCFLELKILSLNLSISTYITIKFSFPLLYYNHCVNILQIIVSFVDIRDNTDIKHFGRYVWIYMCKSFFRIDNEE